MAFITTTNPASQLNIGNIAIYFRPKQCDSVPQTTVLPGYLSTQPIQGSSGALTETLKCTALAYTDVSSPSDPTNKDTLDEYTTQFATDYTNWRNVTFDISFSGVSAVVPNGLLDMIEITYGNLKGDVPATRIYTPPFNYNIQELGSFDYQGDCQNLDDTNKTNFDGSPYTYFYGPPGMCSSGSLQLARYGLILTDGRLSSKFFQNDTLS